ncbi:Dam family site-specific DNA-(adenine-N6)-methyltransferase [Campylobacter helveticus]|uniref:Dam family site-specific DNA-(adenine-N6)-methyltransferase n=1 Tax=Campylobacter helveticus TaxID=28898 RepID=UPI0022EA6F44|nr:Dam family site-specific DNA-(adenine-N6)-methyltransferase [Campylobacter helveticus]
MKDFIISPILYMGNKTRLVKRGLISLFPTHLDTFVDVFAGSASLAMNTGAKQYILNDIDETLHKYYNMFSKHCDKDIINHIKKQIIKFNLPQKITTRSSTNKKEVENYKRAYHNFRENYNKNKNIFDLYTLMFFAFSQQFRINQKGNFNMPFGNNRFSSQNEKNIINGCNFFSQKNIRFYKEDFSKLFKKINLNKEDFVYFDPPYSITTATYNESNKWSKDDDLRLFLICENLHKQKIKFGLSNVFFNKGIENILLKEFCKKHHFNVFTPQNFQYHACGRKNEKQQEVYICNYEVLKTNHNFIKIEVK